MFEFEFKNRLEHKKSVLKRQRGNRGTIEGFQCFGGLILVAG